MDQTQAGEASVDGTCWHLEPKGLFLRCMTMIDDNAWRDLETYTR